jgi:hypothetical protein
MATKPAIILTIISTSSKLATDAMLIDVIAPMVPGVSLLVTIALSFL